MLSYFSPQKLAAMVLSIAVGAAGGWLAHLLGTPMPFLLGAFAASIIATLSGFSVFGIAPVLPMPVRNLFVAVIGVMIGGSFHPGIFSEFDNLWLPALAVVLIVLASLSFNYLIFRKLGRYDKVTSFYSAMPGGLIESVALGERAGGAIETLSLQQFLRITLVITFLPILFQVFTGKQVGSAAGMTIGDPNLAIEVADWLVLAGCVLVGLAGGRMLRLPAFILTGPLILSALAHYFGLTLVGLPSWVISGAQVVVGAGLGSRFRGFRLGQLWKSFWLAVISVSGMLLIGAAMVGLLMRMIDVPFQVLFISFAPGGVTETALIALSLNANPVYVTTLHVFRIAVTVIISSLSLRWFDRRKKPAE